ncbi:hypothetical protein HAX54_017894 [Datura stramonium]|uniref:Uncharacterized protein n=1 Tax=Datura stramonium TaxID=4076 RepID=A0ABS8UPA9_DATST|nr:hypothetical protein [Datura stramonium]
MSLGKRSGKPLDSKERSHHSLSFFFRSGQVGWFVSSSYLRNSLSSFVIMLGEGSCRGAAVKRRFPFPISREGLLPHHSGLLLIGILPMLKIACLPSRPLEKLVIRKEARGSRSIYEAFASPPVVVILGLSLL